MFKVGLTGNLCSGYEDVALKFEKLDVPVFDADVVSKFMIHYDDVIAKEIKIRFGQMAFQSGFLNQYMFDSTPKIKVLLDTINKKLIQSWERFRLKHKDSEYVIFKYALLFERSLDQSMNFNICTFTPKDERVLRLIKSDNLNYIDAYNLIEKGPDDTHKNNLSTYVIHNYSEAQTLMSQINWIDQKLKEKAKPQGFGNSIMNSIIL